MNKNPAGPSSPYLRSPDDHGPDFHQANSLSVNPHSQAVLLRAARATLIEEMCYRLTDLFTLICGRVEILSDKMPTALLEDLQSIRTAAMKGAEFNKGVFGAAQECRREIGV